MDESDIDDIKNKVDDSGEDSTDEAGVDNNDLSDDEAGDNPFGDEEDTVESLLREIDIDGEEKEDPEEAMYVGYVGERQGEDPFIVHTPDGKSKFEYCNGEYPDGRRDIAVYSYRGDVTYGYRWFHKTYFPDKNVSNLGVNEDDSNDFILRYNKMMANNNPVSEVVDDLNKPSGENNDDENLLLSRKNHIFDENNNDMIQELVDAMFNSDPTPTVPVKEPVVKPGTDEPYVKPIKPSQKPFSPGRRIHEDPQPKAKL